LPKSLRREAVNADGNQSEFPAMVGDVILRSDLEDVQAALTMGRCF
jgi:hypothetical protein